MRSLCLLALTHFVNNVNRHENVPKLHKARSNPAESSKRLIYSDCSYLVGYIKVRRYSCTSTNRLSRGRHKIRVTLLFRAHYVPRLHNDPLPIAPYYNTMSLLHCISKCKSFTIVRPLPHIRYISEPLKYLSQKHVCFTHVKETYFCRSQFV